MLSRRRLRSTSNQLTVGLSRLVTVGERSFVSAGQKPWNSLQDHIISASSLTVFSAKAENTFISTVIRTLLCSLFVPVLATVVLAAINSGHLKNVTARRFSVAAPRLWNSLPLNCRTAPSVNTFKIRLKTLLFVLA